jgi:hypothetical protein
LYFDNVTSTLVQNFSVLVTAKIVKVAYTDEQIKLATKTFDKKLVRL